MWIQFDAAFRRFDRGVGEIDGRRKIGGRKARPAAQRAEAEVIAKLRGFRNSQGEGAELRDVALDGAVDGPWLASSNEPWVIATSSAAEGTPTDLMFTPNWLDQKAGTATCGRREAAAQTILWAATVPHCPNVPTPESGSQRGDAGSAPRLRRQTHRR
jgi:hypothetical protein